MRPRLACALVVSLLALAACSVELASDSVRVTHAIPDCAEPGCAAFPARASGAFALAPLGTPFGFDLGSVAIERKADLKIIALNGSVRLNRGEVASGTPAADLRGVTRLELWLEPAIAGAAGGGAPALLASYDLARDGPAGAALPLRAEGPIELKDALDGPVELSLRAAGTLPAVPWTGSLTLDLRLSMKGSVP